MLSKLKNKQFLTDSLPGIFLAAVIGLTSKYLAGLIPNLGGVSLAIVAGLVFRNTLGISSRFQPGIVYAKKKILALAIILMGLKLQLTVLADLGFDFILVIMIMVVSTIGLGFFIGRALGLSRSFSLLLGIGNGICGSSAIGAAAPIIAHKEREVGLSIGVVNLLGTVGIFLLPILANLLQLSAAKSGLMVGGTLQAVGQVVAAGFSISDKVGRLATVVKMGRILMLGPVVLGLNFFKPSQLEKEEATAQTNYKIPPFILGFLVFSLLGSLNLIPLGLANFLKDISKLLLIIAMAGIGLNIELSSLTKQGPTALLGGILIFIGQLSLITILISFI